MAVRWDIKNKRFLSKNNNKKKGKLQFTIMAWYYNKLANNVSIITFDPLKFGLNATTIRIPSKLKDVAIYGPTIYPLVVWPNHNLVPQAFSIVTFWPPKVWKWNC